MAFRFFIVKIQLLVDFNENCIFPTFLLRMNILSIFLIDNNSFYSEE